MKPRARSRPLAHAEVRGETGRQRNEGRTDRRPRRCEDDRNSGIAVGPSGPVALALPASLDKPQESGGASSLMPQIRTIVGDPKGKAATAAKAKPKTKAPTTQATASTASAGAPMALVPPAPKARPKAN